MKRSKILLLAACAVAIFVFVSISSQVSAIGGPLEETLREVGNNEGFQEAGGVPPTAELRREAGEWQSEFNEIANENEASFEEFLNGGGGDPVGGVEILREGSPLGNGGGGGCNYDDGWCPPSCMSCDPFAY